MDAAFRAVLGLDRWFDSMRVNWPTPGYGGPVVHWWRHQLVYRGSGLDWRYEGIVSGYLGLWRATRDDSWLAKARRAGDDLVQGQLPNGQFRNSCFERNPGEGGTPHEAAADVALLMLAETLIDLDPDAALRYRTAAEHNLDAYYFGQLWHMRTATLRDGPDIDSFVPNKAATFLDAIVRLAKLSGDDALIGRYALPTAERILEMQVKERDESLDGAIAQNRFGSRTIFAFYPLYVARCLPPLFDLAEHTGEPRLRDSAIAGARFLQHVQMADGGYPQVLYPSGRRNIYPRWVAGIGDILRALRVTNDHGTGIPVDATINWILRGTRTDGRIITADGFARVLSPVTRGDTELDEIGVAGWCDKAFRALVDLLGEWDDQARELSALRPRTLEGIDR